MNIDKIKKAILNSKQENEQFTTGIVSSLDPFQVKLFSSDSAINVIATNNLHGVKVGSNIVLMLFNNQYIAMSIIQNTPYPIGHIEYVVKSSSQTITNQTSYVTDTDLVITLPKNGIYKFEAVLFVDSDSDTNGDINWYYDASNITSISGRAIHSVGRDNSNTAYNSNYIQMSHGNVNTVRTAGLRSTGWISIIESAILSTSSNNGEMQLRWAQNTSSSGTCQLINQSYLMWEKINNN